ncbi:MAG: DUF2141 domain-containing protein [Pseudomonadota bacterium]
MLKGSIPAALAMTLIAATAPAPANANDEASAKGATLHIEFSSVDPETGKIWVGVCTEEEMTTRYSEEDARCSAERWVDAVEGVTVRFDALAPGTYAVTAFHDEDSNNQLDFDERGIPFEATGNGNNAKGFYGPPTFDAMKFTLPSAADSSSPIRFNVRLYRVDK